MKPEKKHLSLIKLRSLIKPLSCWNITGVLGFVFVMAFLVLFSLTQPAKALPEYASLTGESCGSCHVNPGGGGPRTLRGLLWAAKGKPEKLPALPKMLLAPDIQEAYELYGIACAGCHGAKGEGSSAIALTGTGISARVTRSYILKGIPPLGMPGFDGQLRDKQLDTLVNFVVGLGNGSSTFPPDKYPLAPASFDNKPNQPQKEGPGN